MQQTKAYFYPYGEIFGLDPQHFGIWSKSTLGADRFFGFEKKFILS